ncbi:MAG: RNA-binding protein [Deltaproteobacteria bacterium]|nr:RNA-binding protein [Deltaproteobacteria bacterium]
MQTNKLYVGNIAYSTTKEELEKLFSEFGEVKYVKVIEGKGFAFVEMADREAAEKARDSLNGQEVAGRVIKVADAHPPKRDNEGRDSRDGRDGRDNRRFGRR